MKKIVLLGVAMAMLGQLGACSVVGVKPWQREYMARRSMQLDANPVENTVNEHIYFSKEASSGGRGFAGGGCGCN